MKKSPILALVIVLLSVSTGLESQSFTIMPSPFQTALSNSGQIINNACVWTYLAGTTTQATTYADNIGTANGNPIRADSAGRFTAYLLAGSNYKFLYESSCTPPAHGTLLRTADNIAGTPSSSATVDVSATAGETISAGQCAYLSDGSGGKTAGQWFKCDSANTYSSTRPEIGLAPSAIISAGTGTIRIAGTVTGLAALSVGSTYYVGTSGAITTTAPTNVRAIGVADTASSIIVDANPPTPLAQPTVVTSTVTGTQNNFAPGLVGSSILRMNNATLTTITGVAAGYDGQRLIIQSVGAGQVDLVHQSGSSSAGNKLTNIATSGNTSLAAGVAGVGGSAEYVYDLTGATWRLVSHDQGSWIPVAFSAGNFTGNNSMTFTVTSPQQAAYAYKLSGHSLSVDYDIGLSTVGGTPSTALQVAIPGGFTVARIMRGAAPIINNNVSSTGMWSVSPVVGVNALIQNFLDRSTGTSWTASANTIITAVATFEVL